MATVSTTLGRDAVISEIEIAAPLGRVFEALTDPEQLIRWFTDPSCPAILWEMDPRPGGSYCYATAKGTMVVNGVDEFECHGAILELDPPRLLVYSWIANWHEDKSLETTVRWELFPTENGTRVRVTHSGLAEDAAARKDYEAGWPGMLVMLQRFTEG
jgi:uncharacterized protein YndB with AHSA1/START domain